MQRAAGRQPSGCSRASVRTFVTGWLVTCAEHQQEPTTISKLQRGLRGAGAAAAPLQAVVAPVGRRARHLQAPRSGGCLPTLASAASDDTSATGRPLMLERATLLEI